MMKKVTLGILGGNGMLGQQLQKQALAAGIAINVYDLPDFDISSESDLKNAVENNSCLVNCAAYTAVDKAETEVELCRKVNTEALSVLGRLAKEYDRYVLHLSTDFVFGDLVDQPQTEEDAPNPLNVYGTTKLEGEKLLFESGCRAAVIRLQWTYGLYGNNFISKMIELARTRDKLSIVSDQVGGMTNVEDVSKAILCFLKKEPLGLYHFAAEGYASRYEVARMIFAEMGIEISCEPCSTADLKTSAKRPLNSRFDCDKIDKILDFKRPAWDIALKEYLIPFCD